jgi:hypothetical protein
MVITAGWEPPVIIGDYRRLVLPPTGVVMEFPEILQLDQK